jgi:hypothetical protein
MQRVVFWGFQRMGESKWQRSREGDDRCNNFDKQVVGLVLQLIFAAAVRPAAPRSNGNRVLMRPKPFRNNRRERLSQGPASSLKKRRLRILDLGGETEEKPHCMSKKHYPLHARAAALETVTRNC